MTWLILASVTPVVLYLLVRFNRAAETHGAVLNAYVAKHTYSRLKEDERQAVQRRTAEILHRGGAAADFGPLSELERFSFFALAMNELGIRPALPKEGWHVIRNPFAALRNADHQIAVVRDHLRSAYSIALQLDAGAPQQQPHSTQGPLPSSSQRRQPSRPATALDWSELALTDRDLEEVSHWLTSFVASLEARGAAPAVQEFLMSLSSMTLHSLKLKWGYSEGKPKFIFDHSMLREADDAHLAHVVSIFRRRRDGYATDGRMGVAALLSSVIEILEAEEISRSA